MPQVFSLLQLHHLLDQLGQKASPCTFFKDSFVAEAAVLFRSIAQVVQIAIDFGLPPPEKNKTSSDIFEHSNLTHGAAKEAVLRTAAANVIIKFSEGDRNATAKSLVGTKASSFQKALLDDLKEYADNALGFITPVKVQNVRH